MDFLGTVTRGEGKVALLGAPYDGTTSFRPGARFGPAALREASDGIETYSPYLDLDLEEDCAVEDRGDVELSPGDLHGVLATIGRGVAEILDDGLAPFLLGGEHLVSLPAIQEVARRHEDLCILHLDAHADLRQDYLGNPLSHATVLRRAVEIVGPGNLRQIGIRSGTREEFAFMREHGTQVTGIGKADFEAALDHFGDRPIYLTCDLDVFDPAHLPGTGTPEPGGIDFHAFATLLKLLPGRNLVAADVVELAPMLDASGCSSVLAAKVVRELLLAMPRARR